jgi:uncharacterized protein (TIGR03790 family)
MTRLSILAVALVLGLPALPSQGIAGGDEVVVVYNSDLPESKELAEYYAARRNVPKSQVWGFSQPRHEIISRTEFRQTLQHPLLKKLESSKLWTFGTATVRGTNGELVRLDDTLLKSDVRYAVLCYGVPLTIAPDSTLNVPGTESVRQELRRNEAAVDTELAWLPLTYRHPPLTGPLRNILYTVTNATFIHPTNGVLMVTRLDGPTPVIARGLVDKAIEAETNGLCGRTYFDLRKSNDKNYKTGDDWILGAAEICRQLGFETVVEETPNTFEKGFPMSQIGFYCGWYDLNVSGPFSLPEVEFMPGAFAYHLHSYSANSLRSREKWWVGPLLAKGATITMGCVQEPYLTGTPDIAIFTSRLIYHKFSFGEAAYAAQPVLSWQTTIVGDPLYRPFGRDPLELHKELESRQSKLAEWGHLRAVNLNLARRISVGQAIAYLEQIPLTKQSAVLSEKLGDLCAAAGKPSSAIHAYQQALNLEPTRQQRIRLRLALGEKLEAAGQLQDAYDNYEMLLKEWRDHPDALQVCRKLVFLAKKLDKKEEARKWEEQVRVLTLPPPTNPPPPGKP